MTEIKTVEKSIIMQNDTPFVVLPIKQYEDLIASQKVIDTVLKSNKAVCMDRFYGYDNAPNQTYILYSDEQFKKMVEDWHKTVSKYYSSWDSDRKIKSYRTIAIVVGVLAILSLIGNCILLL